MRHKKTFVSALALVAATASTAGAQERSYLEQRVPAPSNALELKVGTGYAQGFGNLAPGRGIDNVAGAGFAASADVDYRLSRPWSLGVEGQFQEFDNAQNSSSRGLAANVGATYHFDPVLRGDPWARLGTGYRWLWENDPTGSPGLTVLRHGFELLAAKVGYDVRVSEDIALAPVVGADLNLFVWEDPSNGGNRALSSGQVGTFLYAGLQGRFDLGGTRRDPSAQARRRAREGMGVTAPQPHTPLAESPPVAEVEPVSPSLAVSEDIVRACMIHLDNVERAPKFAFDKADLQAADDAVLRQIGDCFTSGPMKDNSLKLVGRADPRGSFAYNDGLGLRRANEVAAFFTRLGIHPDRITTSSRGRRDARGRDEATWATDRRVDVVLNY